MKKITKLYKEVALDLPERDLREFFVNRRGLYAEDGDFQAVLAEVTAKSAIAPAQPGIVRHMHELTEDAHDDALDASAGDRVLDLSNAEDLAEAVTRFSILATCIERQEGGREGFLKNDGFATVIGRFKLESGRVVAVYGDWGADVSEWYCHGWGPDAWDAGVVRVSCNGDA